MDIVELPATTIDCDGCRNRGPACNNCVLSVMIRRPGDEAPVSLDEQERRAIAALAGQGLVPPLRLLPASGHAEDFRVGLGGARPAA